MEREQAIEELQVALETEYPGQLQIVPAATYLGWRKLGDQISSYREVPVITDNPEDTYWMFVATFALLVLAAEGEL